MDSSPNSAAVVITPPVLDNLHTSDPPTPSVAIDHDSPGASNPWVDGPAQIDEDGPEHNEEHRLRTPDPSILGESINAGMEAETLVQTDTRPEISKEILSEFDPLASEEEKAAREAWESSEAHPPPPRTPSPSAPLPPLKDTPSSPPESPPPTASSSSPFPSLTAFARTFSIPSLPRTRPLSLDTAKPVPSPATLSSFASQQQTPRNDDLTTGKDSVTSNSISGGGTESPPAGGGGDKVDPPFDFQKFLDQMKGKSAEPVAKYLRSFLSNFAKKTFTVNDQVKIINDFLNFISTRMRECDVWKNASEAEFDNAMEGMEKLVMNRLYEFTFTPQVVRAIPPRPITADDLERDRVLSQRIALFGWIEEKHLDIPEGEGSKGFLMFAQQELLKINHYKAPRDKLICILNCCKVIFGLIRHLRSEEGADAFVPILIYVVLKANPEHLLSNVEFINRFRNPVKLQSEAGYYLSSLIGAVSFIETMDHTSLSNINQEEFEKYVEEAIQSLPHSEPHSPAVSHSEPSTPFRGAVQTNTSPHAGEESAQPLSLPTPGQTLSEDAKRLLQKTGDTISKPLNAIGRIFSEALDGAEGKLTYLPGPFAPFELGKENRADQPAGMGGQQPPGVPHWSHPDQVRQYGQLQQQGSPGQAPHTPSGGDGVYNPPVHTPYKPRVRRVPSPSYVHTPDSPEFSPEDTPTRHGVTGPYTNQALAMGPSQSLFASSLHPARVQTLSGTDSAHVSRTPTPNLDLAGIQAQIDTAHEQAAEAARDTLVQIFPGMDLEVVELVLEANEGDLGKSIEALLEMSVGA